jgi:hypothetical protein
MIAAAAALGLAFLTAPALAQPQGEAEIAYRAQCRADMLRQNPQSANWVDGHCQELWSRVAAAGPMADAILAVAPLAGAPFNSRNLMAQLAGAGWDSDATNVDLTISTTPPSLTFGWAETGGLIPFEVEDALRQRGARVDLIGCMALGTGEAEKVYRVTPAEGRPFQLNVYARSAPVANAESFYSVVLDLSGQAPSLARLNAGGAGYEATCPY